MFHITIVESIHPEAVKLIEDHDNFSYELIENIDEKNLLQKIENADAVALRTADLTDKIIKNSKKLKIVSRHGVGYDNVDLKSLNGNNIALTITIHANAVTVAEHVLAMMFYLNKKIHVFDGSVRKNQFDKFKFKKNEIITLNTELFEKSILIIGFGRIGKELAKRCHAFGMNIIIYDPYVRNDRLIDILNVRKIEKLSEALSLADYVSIHMPLNEETKNLIDKDKLEKMKKNSIIINTSRGGIVNERDLNLILEKGTIAGAGLDVFEDEPPSSKNPLLQNSKVVLTPHSAALTKECWKRMGIETVQNIFNFFNGDISNKVIVNKDSIHYKYNK